MIPPRRRRLLALRDDRPDWRDPAMPVMRESRSRGLVEVTPEFAQGLSQHKLAHDIDPSWKEDPTYDLKRRCRR